MQTFLAYENFQKSLLCLDKKRLFKQAVESGQILNILDKERSGVTEKIGWQNHPATRMWRNWYDALVLYYNINVEILLEQKFKLVKTKFRNFSNGYSWQGYKFRPFPVDIPPFIGYTPFHEIHRANLVRKDADRYGAMWPHIQPTDGYLWPVDEQGNVIAEITNWKNSQQ